MKLALGKNSSSRDNSLFAEKSCGKLSPASYAYHLPSCPEWGITLVAGLFQSFFQFFDAELFFIAGDKFAGGIVFKHKDLKT